MTVAVSFALTDCPPSVAVTVAMLVVVPVRLRLDVQVFDASGARSVNEQTVKSSPVFPGVPLSSTSEPVALKKGLVFVIRYVYSTGVLTPLAMSVGLAVLTSVMPTGCPVTVTVSFAQTETPNVVSHAVAIFVVVPVRLRVEVQSLKACGARFVNVQTTKSSLGSVGDPLSSTI